jgi:diadenosine tetraphosphate (Ap4A) HIT family hydrolase
VTGDRTPTGCLFCDRTQHKILCESSGFYARFDNFPANPGHIEIVPKRHVVSFFDLTDDEIVEAYRLAVEARTLIDAEHRPDAYTIGVNDGEAAGRSIDHLHIHLIPRHDGDVEDPRGGIRKAAPNWDPDLWASGDSAPTIEPVRWNVCPDCFDRHPGGAACHPELEETTVPRPKDTPTHGVHVIPEQVPEGIVPPSTSMHTPEPTGDLRERLAEALRICLAQAPQRPTLDGPPGRTEYRIGMLELADAVLPIIKAEITALRERTERAENRAEAAGYEATSARLDLREAERDLAEAREELRRLRQAGSPPGAYTSSPEPAATFPPPTAGTVPAEEAKRQRAEAAEDDAAG